MKRTPDFARPAALALALSAAAVATGSAGPARAETVDPATKAAARQLGEEGMQLYDKGECAPAAEKLTRAHELVHVPTLALYAARCLEKLGRLVDASERYLDATRDVVEPSAPAAQRTAQADAERARKALLPRLATVEIAPQPPLPDALVTLDGKPLPTAMFGVKRPIDPGAHTVDVLRGGARTTRSFSIKEGESTHVDVAVPAGPAYPPMYPGPVPYAYPPTYLQQLPVAPPEPPTQRRSLPLYVVGVILIPVGTLAVIGGAVDAVSNTGKAAAGGDALVVLGLVGMGGGIAMTVVGGKRVPVPVEGAPPPPAPAVSFEPVIGPTSLGVRARF